MPAEIIILIPSSTDISKRKTSFDGTNLIDVPFLLVFPFFDKGLIAFPFANSIKYSLPSLNIVISN